MPKKTNKPAAKKAVSKAVVKKDEGLENFIRVTDFQAGFNSLLNKVIKPAINKAAKKVITQDCLIRGCTDFEIEHSDISPILLKAERVCYYLQSRKTARAAIFIIAGELLSQKVAIRLHARHEVLFRKDYDLEEINESHIEKLMLQQVALLNR